MKQIELIYGNCLRKMPDIPNGSIDMVLADPPYGTTSCKWDSIIPFEPMWKQLKRVIKKNGAIVLTASQPFTTILISSNIEMFKYELIWEKNRPTNIFQLKNAFGNCHENIAIFSFGGIAYNSKIKMKYYPRGIIKSGKIGYTKMKVESVHGKSNTKPYLMANENYPRSILKYNNERGVTHPTQKPVALMKYLIKTYTNEGETVLDFTMGSGTTGVACKNLGRKFVGIEMNKKTFHVAKQRIGRAVLERTAASSKNSDQFFGRFLKVLNKRKIKRREIK